MSNNTTLIDLFSGAGGLSEGFFNNDFNIISHVEMDTSAAETLHTRSAYHLLKDLNNEDDYFAYIKDEISKNDLIKENNISPLRTSSIINRELSKRTETSIISSIKQKMKKSDVKKIDGIIGGPPCQAYSLVGRGRRCMKDDPRNYLYYHYLRFLKEFQPSFFVFENVPGIKSAQNGSIYSDLQNKVNKMGYDLYAEILNAENFQVMQSRRRLIIVAFKSDEEIFNYENFFDSLIQKKETKYEVNDLLKDLPPLEPGSGTDSAQEYGPEEPSNYLKKMGIRKADDVLINHQARNHNARDREIYKLTIEMWDQQRKRLSYDNLPSSLQTHKTKNAFRDRYKVVAGDLPSSHTIVAHIAKDGHYHIHPDINQLRSLTVREAARIQSFPDNFKFEGSRTSQYKQVGNAVPPLMAERIAEKIKETIK
jgi:DNA (cytosine-5)-methyltransferase 1